MSLSLGVLGDPIVVINTSDIARNLMNGRSANYAGRPYSVTTKVYVLFKPHFSRIYRDHPCRKGEDWMITNLSGQPHKVRRAIAQRYYSGSAAKNHQFVQEQEARDLLRVIATSPDDLFDHLKRCVIAYGFPRELTV